MGWGGGELLLFIVPALLTGLEYAYIMSPQFMQGIVIGLFWLSAGIGDFLSIALPNIFQAIYIDGQSLWPNKLFINCDRLDTYFFTLSIFVFVCSIFFIAIVKNCDLHLETKAVELTTVIQPIATPEVRRKRVPRLGSVNYGATGSDATTDSDATA